jgi:hypothetical protein
VTSIRRDVDAAHEGAHQRDDRAARADAARPGPESDRPWPPRPARGCAHRQRAANQVLVEVLVRACAASRRRPRRTRPAGGPCAAAQRGRTAPWRRAVGSDIYPGLERVGADPAGIDLQLAAQAEDAGHAAGRWPQDSLAAPLRRPGFVGERRAVLDINFASTSSSSNETMSTLMRPSALARTVVCCTRLRAQEQSKARGRRAAAQTRRSLTSRIGTADLPPFRRKFREARIAPQHLTDTWRFLANSERR